MIRKILLAIIMLIAFADETPAQKSPIRDWCQKGGQQITLAGLTTTTRWQQTFVSCTVTVFNFGTVTPATIYSDSTGTPKANPFTAQSTGLWEFFSNAGTFTVQISNGGLTSPFSLGDYVVGSGGSSGGDITADRIALIPSSITYDQFSNSFGYGLTFGGPVPSLPTTYNVPTGKQLSVLNVALVNSGAGKMFGYEFTMTATGATQDASEPIRGVLGRVTNTLATGASKTSAIRVGSTGTGDALLIANDADVTLSTTSNVSSSIFSGTLFSVAGAVDDRASWGLMWANNNERYLMGIGSTGPLRFGAAAYRAWLATGSSATARGFQQLNNVGTELFFTDINGVINTVGGIKMANGVALNQLNISGLQYVELIKLNSADEVQFGNNTQIATANPYHRLGGVTDGWAIQMVDSDGRFRLNKNNVGELLSLSAAGQLTIGAVLFANLGTPANGTQTYCSDCTNASNPCSSGGTGAIAKRLNGAWDCR